MYNIEYINSSFIYVLVSMNIFITQYFYLTNLKHILSRDEQIAITGIGGRGVEKIHAVFFYPCAYIPYA